MWLDRLRADHDDLVAALQAALDAERTDVALDLVCGLAPLWSMRGYYDAQAELFDRALEARRELPKSPPRRTPTRCCGRVYLGFEYGIAADPAELLERLERGEALARSLHDDETLLRALAHWLVVTPYTGDVARAVAASEEALELAERTGQYRMARPDRGVVGHARQRARRRRLARWSWVGPRWRGLAVTATVARSCSRR